MVKASLNELCKNVYPLTINYDLELEELEEMGRYDRSVYVIDSRSKPPTGNQGDRFALFELVHLNRRISHREAEIALKSMDYYPADIYALMTFGLNYPYVQLLFTVAGIGYSLKVRNRHSARSKEHEMVALPLLVGNGKDRILDFMDQNGEWSESTRFLATKNKRMRTCKSMQYWKWW